MRTARDNALARWNVGTVAAHKQDINKGWIPVQGKKRPCASCGKSLELEEGKIPRHFATNSNYICQ